MSDFLAPTRFRPACHRAIARVIALLMLVSVWNPAKGQEINLGAVTERHVMIPMRDGIRLSAYLYQPTESGPWPALFEQRYASLRSKGTREAAARMAQAGYAVALVNFRGTHLSEGNWVGYRALQWGQKQDGHDVCEWLGTCLLYTSPSPRDRQKSRMPSSA